MSVFVEMPPKAGACQPRHGHERIGRKDYGPAALVLRSMERRKVLMNGSLKYRCLGETVLAETLPDPTACASKRKWCLTAIQKARETLRLMAPDVDPDTDVDISLAGTEALPCISAGCELERAESDGAPNFDVMPDFQWIWIWRNCPCTYKLCTSRIIKSCRPVVLDAARTVCASSDVILIQIRLLCGGLHVRHKELQCLPARCFEKCKSALTLSDTGKFLGRACCSSICEVFVLQCSVALGNK